MIPTLVPAVALLESPPGGAWAYPRRRHDHPGL
jgi:hypothetical protein